jgi:hypothetical protein
MKEAGSRRQAGGGRQEAGVRRSTETISENVCQQDTDADGEAAETQIGLDFARDCGYLACDYHARLLAEYEAVGRMLGGMLANPERFVQA